MWEVLTQMFCQNNKRMALIRITRDRGFADRMRAYRVLVDGQEIGEIRSGETKEFPIAAGPHELTARIDWAGSQVIRFTAAEGTVSCFVARSNLRGARLLLALWYIS